MGVANQVGAWRGGVAIKSAHEKDDWRLDAELRKGDRGGMRKGKGSTSISSRHVNTEGGFPIPTRQPPGR